MGPNGTEQDAANKEKEMRKSRGHRETATEIQTGEASGSQRTGRRKPVVAETKAEEENIQERRRKWREAKARSIETKRKEKE